jgi:hypothetical protein
MNNMIQYISLLLEYLSNNKSYPSEEVDMFDFKTTIKQNEG